MDTWRSVAIKFATSGAALLAMIVNAPIAHGEQGRAADGTPSALRASLVATPPRSHLEVTVVTEEAPASLVENAPSITWDRVTDLGDRVILESGAPDLRASARAEAQGDGFADILCGRSYGFGDANGKFFIQRACSSNKAPWGYQLSSAVQKIVAGPVSERGMDWIVNGALKPRQAPHSAPANYRFHGTFTVKKGDALYYDDVLSFRHNLGPGGTARITIDGSLYFQGR